MSSTYNKYSEFKEDNIVNDLFNESLMPSMDSVDETLETPVLIIDLKALDKQTYEKAKTIAERLAYYFLDEEYIEKHQYVKSKITQEVDNIRRLLKMLAVNEQAQDTLIMSITMNAGKGTLYTSLTSLQNSMLSMQSQLNQLTANLENIFKEMQTVCEKTFDQKEHEQAPDGSIIVRGSRAFIEQMEKALGIKDIEKETSNIIKQMNDVNVNIETGEMYS